MSQVRIPSSHHCSPSGKELTIRTVGPVVKRLTNPFMWAGDEIVVDLSSTLFVRPSGLVPLATSVEIGQTLGYKVRVVCPTDVDCRSYMATSGVLRHCHCLGLSLDRSDGVEHRAATRSRKLIALRALHTDSDVASVRLDVAGVLGALLGSGGPAWAGRKAAFTGAIHEMSKNVVDYGNGASGYVLAQKYRNGYDKRWYVEFAVGDAGPGIPSTLRRDIPSLTGFEDHEILAKMIREQLTSRAGGGGHGYDTVRRFTGDHTGHFDLRSGYGSLRLDQGMAVPTAREVEWEWPGTVLSGAVTCPK